ncbi:MAG: c-type cytochrome [Acidobacteriota bacterium]|nr:c-type cytochrome [Acidobacteriota bacterium]
MIAVRSFQTSGLTLATMLAVASACASPAPRPRQQAAVANPTPEDLQQGKATFESTCSTCHGLDGGGGMGPNIQGIPFTLGMEATTNVIKNGMSGAMPAFGGQLSAAQIQQVVQYLLTLKHQNAFKVTGDPEKGKAVYESSGCADCHMIDGQGGDSAPDLSNVGALRDPGYLRTTLLYPGTDLPQQHLFLETGGKLDYVFVRLVAKDGRALDGTRVAEDSFRIVIEDAKGNFHSFDKPDLRELKEEPGKSLMPSYKGKLSDAQINDLVAYLASLKEAQ